MIQVVGLSRQKPKFDPRPIHVRIVVAKVAMGQVYAEYSVFLYQYHSTYVPYSQVPSCYSCQKDKRTKTWLS